MNLSTNWYERCQCGPVVETLVWVTDANDPEFNLPSVSTRVANFWWSKYGTHDEWRRFGMKMLILFISSLSTYPIFFHSIFRGRGRRLGLSFILVKLGLIITKIMNCWKHRTFGGLGKSLPGTRDKKPQTRNVPYYTGRLATLVSAHENLEPYFLWHGRTSQLVRCGICEPNHVG